MVEVERFSAEDTLPLGRRDSSRCVLVEFCEEFSTGDVFVVDLEVFASLPAAVVIGEGGGVVRVKPSHIALSGSPLLPRWLVGVVDVILEVISGSGLVSNLVEDFMDGLIHRLILFWTAYEESGISCGVDGVEFLNVKVDGLFLFKIGEGGVFVDEHTNP